MVRAANATATAAPAVVVAVAVVVKGLAVAQLLQRRAAAPRRQPQGADARDEDAGRQRVVTGAPAVRAMRAVARCPRRPERSRVALPLWFRAALLGWFLRGQAGRRPLAWPRARRRAAAPLSLDGAGTPRAHVCLTTGYSHGLPRSAHELHVSLPSHRMLCEDIGSGDTGGAQDARCD